MENSTISCLCITFQRVPFLKKSIQYFEQQTHKNKELLVIYQKSDKETFTYAFSNKKITIQKHEDNQLKVIRKGNNIIRFIEVADNFSLGEKRNLSVQLSKGNYICIWDDDDHYSPLRLEAQLSFLKFSKKEASTLANLTLYEQKTNAYFLSSPRNTGWEGSLLCKKEKIGLYKNLNKKEDTPVIEQFISNNELAVMDAPELYIYHLHNQNTSDNCHFEEIINYSLPADQMHKKKLDYQIKDNATPYVSYK